MLEPAPPQTALTKQQARALGKSEFISYLSSQADLSDAARYLELARHTTRQHEKVELMAGAIVGIILGWLLGGGTWFSSLVTGVFALFATLVLIFLFHWIRSPSAFHKAAIAERNAALTTLSKMQIGGPRLAGRINCLAVDIHHHPSQPEGLYADCWFTMNVNIWNDGGVGTNVTGFRFLVRWASSGDNWPTRQVEGLERFRTRSLRPSDPGSEDRYAPDIENLFDFPVPSEVTLTNSQNGWLRFVARDFPLKAGMQLDFDTEITLVALDKKGEPHTIYEGAMPGRDCPPIEAVPTLSEPEARLTPRPEITGGVYDLMNSYYYDEPTEWPGPDQEPPRPLGTQIVLSVWLRNNNPTPTTLHNFRLQWEALGKTWIAEYAEEVTAHKDRDIWPTGEIAVRNRKMVNLSTCLGSKSFTQDARVEGYLVFRLAGMGIHVEGLKPEDLPPEGWPITITLYIEDAWGAEHVIRDPTWSPARPSLRLSERHM